MATRKKTLKLAPLVRATKIKRKRATRSRRKTVTPARLKNNIYLVLDESGSMSTIRDQTVKTVNDVINTLKVESLKVDQDTAVAVTTFNTDIKHSVLTAVEWVQPINGTRYMPSGGTRLFDAVGEVLEQAVKTDDGVTSYVLNVITDGEENGSRDFNSADILDLLKRAQATDRWTIVFLVPPGAKVELCRRYKIPEGNVREWEGTNEGIRSVGQALTASYGSYFSARSTGATSSKTFFTTDLSKLKSSDVKRNLSNMANDVKVLQVKKETDIKAFVEGHGYTYSKGVAFYQLTKDETLQPFKNIMLMEKGKTEVYGGPDARTLLGLPADQEVVVKPGNHANWDVYVQSTSSNRKLVRGTNLLLVK